MDSLPPLREVDALQCFLIDSDRVRKQSVLEIKTNTDLTSGVLGCKSWDSLCEQCGETTHNCPGHTGHMELPIPCFHVGAMSTLLKILNLVCFYCQRLRITSHMCEKVLQLPSEKRLNTLLKYTRFFRACECGKSYIKWTTESGHDNIIRGVVTLSKTDFQLYQSNPSWKPISFGPFEIQKLLEDISKNEQMMHIMGLGQYNLPKARMFSALAVPALTTRPNSTFPTKNGSKQYPNDWTKMLKNVLQSKLLLEMKLQQSKDPIILSQYLYKGFIHPDFKVCFQKESLTSEERKQLNIQQRQQYRAQLQLINQKLSKCKLSNEASCGNVTNQCAWRNLQNQISAFHFEKYRKLIPKNAQYGKTPNSVDTKFKKTSKSKQSSRMQGFIVAWRKYHYARLVLEGCTWIHPTYCGLPQSTCMGLTINVPVSSFNMNQAHKWILNGPHHYPGANSMQMKDGRTIDLEYYDNRRDINVHDVAYVRRHILEDDWVIVNRAPTLHRGSTMGFKVKVIPNSFVINLHVSVFLPFNADCDGDELSVHIPQTIEARAEVMEIMAVKFHTMKDGGLWIKFSQNPVIGAFLLTHEDTFLTKDQVSVLLGHVTRFITIPPPAVWKPRQLWTGRQVMHCILPSSIHIHTVFTEKVLNGVLRDIIMYHSLDEAMDFLYEGYLITQEYLDMRGHSCSYHQMYWEDADSCPNYHKLQNMQEQPEDVVGQHIQFYTKSIQDRIEELVTARDRNTLHNGYLAMIQSGTKANWASLSQMMGVVGQAYLTHERIPNVTSHFHPHDKSLVAHGFIKHPYAMGLTFHDLMTQAQPTTESVINKIKGTSQSGYLEKKMAYCNMGIIADTFGHAVDSYSGNRRQHAFRKEDIHKPGPTVWFTYGGDSLDPQYLVWETITPPTLELWPNHHHHVFYRESWLLWDKIKDQDLTFKSPFHIKHLFQQATTYTSSPDLMETEIITSFTYIWQSMVKERLVPAQHHKLHVLLRVWCCPHNVLVVWKLSSVAWYKLLRLIYHTIQRRTILPGEAIGMNATHSVGEVYTQGNLKSPHSSGKKNTQVTGVNKLNNLIDANNSLAMMNIVFLPHVTEAEVHYTAMTWRTVYLSEILSDYPKIDESSMTIRLHIDPKLKAYYLVQDYNIILALHHTIQIPISAIHKVDKTLFCIRLTPSVGIWTFALRQIKCKVKNPTTHALYGVAYNIFHQTIVRGKLDGISKYIIEQQASNRWVCITDQSDFSIWNTHPLVDVQQSYSTHTGDTQKFMGVYATTQVLTHEFVLVMGDSTDARHLELMARYMTMTGIHEGYKKNEAAKRIAPMQQASFEESSRHVMENVDMGRWDPGNTIAAAAMCNKNMGLGSGYHFQMIQDVIPFRPKKLEFQPQRYVMVPYLNGIRGLLLFTTYKNCIQLFLMDQQKKTTKLKHMPSKLPIPLFAGTVLDGEMVQLNDQGFCFTIMDCYMMCGNPAKHLRYDQRWELAIQAIQMISKCPTASTTSISVSPCVVKSSLYPTLYNKVVHHPEIPFGLHVKPLVEMSHILKFTYMLPIEALDFMDTSSEALSSSSSSSSSYGSKVIPQLRLRSHRIYCTIQPFESIRELPWPDGTPSTVQYYRFYQGDYLLKSKDNVIISAAICPYPLPKNAVVACEYRDAQWIISGPSQSLPFTWKQVTDTIIAIAENISVNELLPFPVIQ